MKFHFCCFCILFLLSIQFPVKSQTNTFEPPKYAGGNYSWKEFLRTHMVYPEKELNSKTSGKVEYELLIDTKGQILEHKLISGLTDSINLEALRLLSIAIWQPAISNETPVIYKIRITIPFNAKDYSKIQKVRPAIPDSLRIKNNGGQLVVKVDQQPKFGNSNNDLASFIKANLVYPIEAKTRDVVGAVKIEFVVEPNGLVSNARIINGLGAGCDEEAIRLVYKMLWKPASIENVKVRSVLQLPIFFQF